MVHGLLVDAAFARFKRHRETIQDIVDANEDTTRLRAIDTILFDVLGWKKAQVETERHVRATGFADYFFETEYAHSLVLEAKSPVGQVNDLPFL